MIRCGFYLATYAPEENIITRFVPLVSYAANDVKIALETAELPDEAPGYCFIRARVCVV